MKLYCVAVALVACLAAHCNGADPSSSDQRSQAVSQAGQTTAALYDLIRSIAFPDAPVLNNEQNQDTRFILLMPGKVLNYFDYYPGREYTKFIQVRLNCCSLAMFPINLNHYGLFPVYRSTTQT